MLVQRLAFEKLVTTKTLTNKLIMHQDRAVGKSPAGLCRCFRDVAEKPKIAEMLTFARHDLEDKTRRKGGFGLSSRIMSLPRGLKQSCKPQLKTSLKALLLLAQ